MKLCIPLLLITSLLCGAEYYDDGKLQQLTPIVEPTSAQGAAVRSDRSNGIQWYATESGTPVGVGTTLLVKWRDPSQAESVVRSMNGSITEWLNDSLTVVDVHDGDIFTLSQALYHSDATIYAQPNFRYDRSLR